MDFGLDDPLESDDSFFEEPKILSKKPSLTKSDKKSVEDIFNFGEETKSKEDTKRSATVKFEDDTAKKPKEDWLGIGNPETTKKEKKTDFLEDILGSGPSSLKSEKKVASFEDILKDSKATAATINPKPNLKAISQKEETGLNLLSEASARDKRRPRRPSGTPVEDVLGLFGTTTDHSSGDFSAKPKPEIVKQPEPKEQNLTIPGWLGGSSATKSDTTIKPDKSSTTLSSNESGIQKDIEKVESSSIKETKSESSIKIDFQNSYSALQQQESMLLVSMQLKKYEENLFDIKKQQQEILNKQEKQFEDLVERYIKKQQVVENSIVQQQERINDHIKLLISEPMKRTESSKNGNEEKSELDALVKNLQQRHAEEFFLMEESYKKQISLLEKSSESLEERLKSELNNLKTSFEQKIESLQTQQKNDIEYYKQKIQNLSEEHSQEIELLKLNQNRVIEDLKNEHLSQLEYLKQTNNFENSLKQDASSYGSKLDASIEALTNNSKVLIGLQEKVSNDYNILSVARESSIETKEKEVGMMRISLEKCREMAEKERTQLMNLVRTLETKLAEQNENSREERWALQQAAATLTARAAALDREAEFNRNSLEREREQLKTLKESMLAEQERLLMEITEEKLQLAAEKSRFEASAKLSRNYEAEKLKTEAETAIQVAREVTEQINQEREQIIRHKSEVENLRRELLEKQREMIEKNEELEYLTRNAREEIRREKRATTEAKNMENKYKEKLRELQGQVSSLSVREKKLAEEKLLLSKERLALFTAMKQGHKKCILCKTEDDANNFRENDFIPQNNIQDLDVFRLRIDTLEDERNSEVSKEDSHNINEMS